MGEKQDQPSFSSTIEVDFRGSRFTSNDGLTASIETGGLEIIQRNAERWRRLWEETDRAPFYRPEWISTYIRVFEPASQVVLLTVSSENRLLAVLPLVRKTCWYAGVPLVKLAGPANVHSVRFDILCSSSPAGEAAIRELWKLLNRTPGWQILELPTFPKNGACQKLMAYADEDRYPTITVPYHAGPLVTLRSDGNGRLTHLGGTSRHFRHELRRFARLLEMDMGGKPSFVLRTDAEPDSLRKFYALERSGWKGRQGTAIACDPQTRAFYDQIARVSASLGCFRLHSLELNGKMAAGAFSVATGACFFPMKIGYDEALHRAGPGQVLFHAILAECAEKRIPELYFGGREDRFKMSWTSETLPHFNGLVFAPDCFRAQLAYRLRTNVMSPLGRFRRRIGAYWGE